MKKITVVFCVLILFALGWYLFIKKADYIYQFKEKSSTGSIFYSISNWQKTNDVITTKTIDSTLYSSIVQELTYNNKNYVLYWDINVLNDSITEVSVGIKEPKNSLRNRITVPFTTTDFTTETKEFLIGFKKMLDLNTSTFSVNIAGKTTTPEKKCACVNAKTSPEGKTKQMMRNYSYLSSYVVENNITPDGKPMVIINAYDKVANSIDMDFCFPIKGIQKLPGVTGDIFLKEVQEKNALKATFNGNYMYTQHAWYSLFDYANMHSINLSNEIVEVFFNNPNLGGNALNWKSEIYIPIITD